MKKKIGLGIAAVGALADLSALTVAFRRDRSPGQCRVLGQGSASRSGVP